LIELGLLDHRDEMARSGSDRLLPDCQPYRLPDGRLRWSQQITKSWQYVKTNLKIVQRADVTLYSTRHTMADMIDQLALSARTRDRVLGHANSTTAAGTYGRNGLLSTEELKKFSGITNPLIDGMRDILLPPKQAADAGRLKLIRPTAPMSRKDRQKESE
jgi:integrase